MLSTFATLFRSLVCCLAFSFTLFFMPHPGVFLAEAEGQGCQSVTLICPLGEPFTITRTWDSARGRCVPEPWEFTEKAKEVCQKPSGNCEGWWGRADGCSADAYLISRYFTPACDIHDVCFSSPCMKFADCNAWFATNIRAMCAIPERDPQCDRGIDILAEAAEKLFGVKAYQGDQDYAWNNCTLPGRTAPAGLAYYVLGGWGDFDSPLGDKDCIGYTVTDNPDPSKARFCLETPGYITWYKEIASFQCSGDQKEAVGMQDDNHGPKCLDIPNTATPNAALVFTKAKALGIHTGLYELRNLEAYNGKQVNFSWVVDSNCTEDSYKGKAVQDWTWEGFYYSAPRGATYDGDKFDISVVDGEPGMVTLCLATHPSVTWYKEINFFTYGGTSHDLKGMQDTDHGPKCLTMPVVEARWNYFVLTKAKALGIHTGMYVVRDFSSALAGKKATLTWTKD